MSHSILDVASLASDTWVKNMWEVGGSSQFAFVALTASTVGQRHHRMRWKTVAFGCDFMSHRSMKVIVLGCVCRLDLGRNFSAMVRCLRRVRTVNMVLFKVLPLLKKVHWIWKSNTRDSHSISDLSRLPFHPMCMKTIAQLVILPCAQSAGA